MSELALPEVRHGKVSGLISADPTSRLMREGRAVAGLDLGERVHPSHLTVLVKWPVETIEDKLLAGGPWSMGEYQRRKRLAEAIAQDGALTKPALYQVASVWFDEVPLSEQLSAIAVILSRLGVRVCAYDATRGELAVSEQRGELPPAMRGYGVVFTREHKAYLAALLARAIERRELHLLDDPRQTKSLLTVNNLLQAQESEVGHGDAFWSLAMAVALAEEEGGEIATEPMKYTVGGQGGRGRGPDDEPLVDWEAEWRKRRE